MRASNEKRKSDNDDNMSIKQGKEHPCPEECMERLANDLITAVRQKVRLTDPENAAQMALYNLEVQLVDILRLIGRERTAAIAAAQAEAEKLNQAKMISEEAYGQYMIRLKEAERISKQIQTLNLTLAQIEKFKEQISQAAIDNHWDDYDKWVATNFSSIPQEEIERLKIFIKDGGMATYSAVLGGYDYIKNYGLPTWYLLMTAICRLPTWCQDILRLSLGDYAWILDYALTYCVIWEAQAGMITYKKVTTLDPAEVIKIKDLFDRAYTGSCIMIGALLGSITRAGAAAGEAANTAFLRGLHALPNFVVVPGNFYISGTPPASPQSSLGDSQAESVSSSDSVITCGEGPPQDRNAQDATFILPSAANNDVEFAAINQEINQEINQGEGAFNMNEDLGGGRRRGRRSRRHKKRRSTLKRRRMKRRRTRKGKKRRHTKRR